MKLYAIDRVLEEKGDRVLVKWTGYARPTWEPRQNIYPEQPRGKPVFGDPDVFSVERVLEVSGARAKVQWANPAFEPSWVLLSDLSEDLRKPPTRKTKRKVEDVYGECAQKRRVNEMFAQAARIVKGEVAVLDARGLGTSAALRQAGFKGPIVAMNWDGEEAGEMVRRQEELGLEGVDVQVGAARDVLERYPLAKGAKRWKGVHLDFCCTVRGNAWCSPLQDICILTKTGRLGKGSIVGLTVSLRDRRGSSGGSRGVVRKVRRSVGKHGIKVKVLETMTYKGPMLFLLMKFY